VIHIQCYFFDNWAQRDVDAAMKTPPLWRSRRLSPERTTRRAWKPIMTPRYGTTSFATKVGYFVFAAVLVVFVSMLVLRILHP
jgi:hypothetical protein